MFQFWKNTTRPVHDFAPQTVNSTLGEGSTASGRLRVSGNCLLMGSFEGTLEVSGELWVSSTARVVCQSIKAKLLVVAGSIKGDVVADRVEIRSTGRIFGNLLTNSFQTDEGGFVRGQVQLSETQTILQIETPSAPTPETDSPATPDSLWGN